MKCTVCKRQFSTKGEPRCPVRLKSICDVCYNLGKAGHQCDTTCKNTKPPRIDYYPLTTAIAGFSPAGVQKCTTEEFMPKAYEYMAATNAKFVTQLKDIRRLKVSVEFVLSGNPKLSEEVYLGEEWKRLHLGDALNEAGVKSDTSNWGPLPVLFLDRFLRVMPESLKLTIDGENRNAVINDTPELIATPDCLPPPHAGKKRFDKFSFFCGKSIVLFGPVEVGVKYHIEVEIEALNFNYLIGLLLPFKGVEFDVIDMVSSEKFPLVRQSVTQMRPINAAVFPPKQEYNWSRPLGEVSKPSLDLADPFRDQPFFGDVINTKPKAFRDVRMPVVTTDYEMITHAFWCGLNKDYFPYQVIPDVQVTASPLPIRIYEQIQRLPEYRDLLITFDVINFKRSMTKIEVSSEILGYTDKQIDNIEIPGMGSGKSARVMHSQKPKLKRGVLKDTVLPTTATLGYEIVEIDGTDRKLLEQGTKEVRLLANDQIIWSLNDARGSMSYDLGPMIGAWVYPDDPGKKLDRIRGAAKKYHPDNALEGGPASLASETAQVKALFDYLNSETNISYVSHAFKHGLGTFAQRVLTPENVIDAESGNCIDLTVLFASLMEGLGINPLIMLTQEHAFLGWGDKTETNKMEFLECTVLGGTNPNTGRKYTFEEAAAMGRKAFQDEFLFIGSDDPMPFSIPGKNQIIDLSVVRGKGIYHH